MLKLALLRLGLRLGLCLGFFLLPGCFFIKDAPPADSAAAPARPPAPDAVSIGAQADRSASAAEADKTLTQEEGHPFWVVVGGALGFVAAAAVVALMVI